MADHGAHPEVDHLRDTVEEAMAAFTEARAAFEQLEATHDRAEYKKVAERLRILGETLSNVRGEAMTYRLHVVRRHAHD